MEFARSELWILLVIPLLTLLILRFGRVKLSALRQSFARVETLEKCGYRKPMRTILRPLLLFPGILMITLAALQPQWGTQPESFIIQGLDMVVVLDISASMTATDVQPDRITFAKQVITTIVDNLDNDRLGLIAFSGKPHYYCPLTVDYEAFKLYLEALNVQDIAVPGTAMDVSLTLAQEVLASSEGKYRVILLVSDGEDHSEQTMDIVRDLADQGIVIYTIGIGTRDGGPLGATRGGIAEQGYKKDKQGNVVISKLNEDLLYGIGKDSGGGYYRATPTLETIDLLKKELSLLKRGKIKEEKITRKKERFQIPLLLGIILISLEYVLIERGKEDEEE